MRRIGLVLLAIVSMLSPGAAAHAAPDPPEYMTRLLHDYNDDWGSDASQTSLRDGHDLIALDLREEYNKTLGQDTLVFRLSMNYGYDADANKPELRDVLTFKAKGQSATYEFKTSNNAQFTGTFDSVYGPVPLRKPDGQPDGARFYVEGLLKFSSLGLAVGDKVSEFFVQGYGGAQKGDHMVGGNVISNAESPSEQSSPASYRRPDYTLRGPVMYARSTLDKSKVDAKPGDNQTITWSITNTVGRSQGFTISTTKPTGVQVGLHGVRYAEDTLTFQVPAGTSATVHVYVRPQSNAQSGDLDLILDTSLGGRMVHHVDVTIGGKAASSSPAAASGPTNEGAESPSASAAVILAVVAIGVAVVKRRSR